MYSTTSKTEIAPIALFVFNRPHLTAQVYQRIRQARPRRMFVVADGPREGHPEDRRLCLMTRQIVSSPDWPCELLTNFSEENLGNGYRISSGLDWVFGQCAEAIILEDDCLPCPSFFSFCSSLLTYYRDDTRIMHISGNNYQDGVRRGNASYFFSRYSLSWGWASWARAWRHYDFSFHSWPTARDEDWLKSVLEDPMEIEYWTPIFERLYRGLIDTWDYQWLLTCWFQNGLSIQPNINLVSNVGVGPDATNFKQAHSTIGVPTQELRELVHPRRMNRDIEADRFTFKQHIAPKPVSRFQKFKNEIALRSRMKRLVRRYCLV
jgi:hypothetical protein